MTLKKIIYERSSNNTEWPFRKYPTMTESVKCEMYMKYLNT